MNQGLITFDLWYMQINILCIVTRAFLVVSNKTGNNKSTQIERVQEKLIYVYKSCLE
jgi:hypothetical protein